MNIYSSCILIIGFVLVALNKYESYAMRCEDYTTIKSTQICFYHFLVNLKCFCFTITTNVKVGIYSKPQGILHSQNYS